MAKWAKGESGNPGGRPSGHGEIREIARQYTDTAIGTLVRIMNDAEASPNAQVAAATALLDRGWGRPQQSIKAEGVFDMGSALQEVAERMQREQEEAQASPQKLAS